MPTLDLTSIQLQDASATKIRRTGIYTGPASYATGGDAFTPANIAMGKIDVILFEPPTNGTVILLARYDYTNQKVKFFDLAGNESANGTNLSTYSARFEAIGK